MNVFLPTVIRASAGSGKTFQLSNRYLGLLARGIAPERILATTFTRKAAGEIFERVLQRLAEAVVDRKATVALGEDLGVALNGARAGELLMALIAASHRHQICTLDSFFVRMATSFSYDLGLLPGWQISDDQRESEIADRVVRVLCERDEIAVLVELLRLLNLGEHRRSVHVQLVRELRTLTGLFAITTEAAWNWLQASKPCDAEELRRAADRIRSIPLPLTKTKTPHKHWENARAQEDACIAADDWESWLASGIVNAVASGRDTYAKQEITRERADLYRPLLDHACAVLVRDLAQRTAATYALLGHYSEQAERIRHRLRSFGFDDVKLLLADAALGGRLDELYYRLDTQIDHVLLDEFQDTSLPQWLIIEPIVDELLSKYEAHAFLCVGDVKQAIYGWRGGQAAIFDRLENRWPQLQTQALNHTRRCSRAVVEFVNRVFGSLQANAALNQYPEVASAWQERFSEHETLNSSVGFVTFLDSGPAVTDRQQDESEDAAAESSVLSRAALLTKEILAERPGIEIGILARRNQTVSAMLAELAAIGVSASEEGGGRLTDSPAVQALLALCRLIDHPGDRLARFHVATSPIGPALGYREFSDDSATLLLGRKLRAERERVGLVALFADLVATIEQHYSTRDRRRLAQVVEQALLYDRPDSSRLTAFVDFLSSRKVEDPIPTAVRVMTIHQSKGLEFDCVILPELDQPIVPRQPDSVLTFTDDPLRPPSRVVRYPKKELRQIEPALQEMYRQNHEFKINESLSLLYVALTRARTALYLVVAGLRSTRERSAARSEDRAEFKWPLSFSGVMQAALKFEQPIGADATAMRFEIGDPAWGLEKSDPRRKKRKQSVAASSAPLHPTGLLFERPAKRRGLARRTPSSLEGGSFFDLERLFQRPDPAALARGMAIHRLFREVEWLDRGLPEARALAALLSAERFAEHKEIVDEFLGFLTIAEVRSLFDRERYLSRGGTRDSAIGVYETAVRREQGFAVRDEGTIISGSFDRLVTVMRSGRTETVEVLDFKTDRGLTDQIKLSERVAFYAPQMEAYRRSASLFCRVPLEAVSVKLVFLVPGAIVEV